MILVEAQFAKNPKSKTYKTIKSINAKTKLCLTGTPMENHYGELWALFNIISPGLLGTEKSFKKYYRTPIEKHANAEIQQHLSRRLAPFMLRRNKDEVVKELPKKTQIIRKVELTQKQRDLYESVRLTMEKKIRKALQEKGLAQSHIVILDALLKLRQICCHTSLLKTKANSQNHESAKLELLADMLESLQQEGRKVLIFSSFTSMLKIIETILLKKDISYVKLTGSTKDRQTPINTFQNGNASIFLISLKAGGTGLNLTAADTVIHYDPWWNPAAENQATDRAHRIGQQKPVFVYKLVSQDTVEEKILDMQQRKQALLKNIFSDAKAMKFTDEDVKYLLS